jgi:hypothetical protein
MGEHYEPSLTFSVLGSVATKVTAKKLLKDLLLGTANHFVPEVTQHF